MIQDMTADEIAIRNIVAEVEASWNTGDGDRFAAPFAADADYVVVDGNYIKGRQIIAEGHNHIFATVYRDSHNVASVHNIRFLRPDVAVAHVAWHLTFQHEDATRQIRAFSTLVLARTDEAWHIAAFQNTPVVPRRS